MGDPRILLLDDATSAVDAKVEQAIHAALRDVMRDRTTLLVAHRRSTLHLADRIVVVDGGRVVDQGTDAELLERVPLYRSISSGKDETAERSWPPTDRPCERCARGAGRRRGRRRTGPGLLFGHRLPRAGVGRPWRQQPERLAGEPRPDSRTARKGGGPQARPRRPQVNLGARPRRAGVLALALPRPFPWRPRARAWSLFCSTRSPRLAGPYLVRAGINDGVVAGSRSALFVASLVYLAVALLDLVDSVAETFVTGRTAERLMLALRIRIWAKLQRQSLDYYEREMAGRIMTRMTTDVDSFETLLETGLVVGGRELLHLHRRRCRTVLP